MQTLTQCLTQNLIPLIPSAAIYISETESPDPPTVILLTSSQSSLSAKQTFEQASHALQSCPAVSLNVFSTAKAREQLEHGSLYFVRNYLLGELLYENSDATQELIMPFKAPIYFDKALHHYRSRLETIEQGFPQKKQLPQRNYLREALLMLQNTAQGLLQLAGELAFGLPETTKVPNNLPIAESAQDIFVAALSEITGSERANTSFTTHVTDVKKLGKHTKKLWREVCRRYDLAIEECRLRMAAVNPTQDSEVATESTRPLALPENNQPESLVGITRRLANYTGAEAIFTSQSVTSNPSYTMMLVLVEEELKDFSMQLFNATNVTTWYDAFQNRIYTLDYARQEYEKGNLYFILNWALGQMVYSKNEGLDAVCGSMEKAGALIELGGHYFDREIEKINAFREGSHFFLQNGNLPQAAFLLHQSVELLFRTAEWFLTGRSKISHKIMEHQRYLRDFAPSIGTLFNYLNEQDRRLMHLFDTAYIDARYDHYEVSRANIELFQVKATQLQQETQRMFDETLRQCRERLANYNATPPALFLQEPITREEAANTALMPIPTDSAIEEVLSLVNRFLKADAIYCFGKRTQQIAAGSLLHRGAGLSENHTHFDLLILVSEHKPNAVPDLIDLVRTKTAMRYSVTPLIHKSDSILNAPKKFRYFFHEIMTRGELVFQNADAPSISYEALPVRDFEAAKQYWRKRDAISDIFFEGTMADNTDEGMAQMAMAHIAMEQVCLGLIEVFLGYRPQHFALGYLMDLCRNFTHLPDEIFPRRTVEDKRLFKMLALSISDLRHKEPEDYSYVDTSLIQDRCQKFLKQASILAVNELDRIMNKAVADGVFLKE